MLLLLTENNNYQIPLLFSHFFKPEKDSVRNLDYMSTTIGKIFLKIWGTRINYQSSNHFVFEQVISFFLTFNNIYFKQEQTLALFLER